MNRLHELQQAGTSPWLDFIRRDMLQDGSLEAKIKDHHVFGMTSNPSIFAKAFATSDLYDDSIQDFLRQHPDASITDLYEHEAIRDIQAAADLLRPVYESTNRLDGYVSLEVNPELAHETEATILQAKQLFQAIDRPNAMIKIPATPEGLPAIRQAIREGININVTLIFSIEQYVQVVDAFISGLEDRAQDGHALDGIASVASFFVSRVDRAIDPLLPGHSPLKLKTAIANSRLAYEQFQRLFFSPRFKPLKDAGAQVQRVLWASTSMKDPDGRDVAYVESLIGPHTVNTMPPDTLDAFADHGEVSMTVADGLEEAEAHLEEIVSLGIHLNDITQKLLADGVKSFADDFESLLQTVGEKRNQVLA